ncbi:MAG: hypothetical protein QM477_08035 [Planctomycetota bacterium]
MTSSRIPTPCFALFLSIGLYCTSSLQAQNPNDPGLLDPVIQTYLGRTWRLPSSHQVTPDSEQINIVGRVRKTRADQDVSSTGQAIQNTDDPSQSLRNGLESLQDAAMNNQMGAMTLAAEDLRAILLGTTQGSIYDGFAMLNYNRGTWQNDHVAGEYKTKRLTDRGQKIPGLDGRLRTVWEADVNLLYYDEDVDSDTFFLIAPLAADFRDSVQLNYTVYSTGTESFSPSTLVQDLSPFGEGALPSKGFDAAWVPLSGNEVTRISIDHGSLGTLRGVQLWGWYAEPDRSQYMEIVREELDAQGGTRFEVRGATMMELLRGLNLDSIGDAAPEMKILQVADAVLAGSSANQVLAMLQQGNVAPLGTLNDWRKVLQGKDSFPLEALQILALEGIQPDVFGPNRLGPYDAILVYANHEVYSTSLDLEGHDPLTGFSIPLSNDPQGSMWKVKVINLDNTTHYLQTHDYGPALHDDIATCRFAPSGGHSLEIYVDQVIQGGPKMDELQWRLAWGLRDGLGVVGQFDIFTQAQDLPNLQGFLDQSGQALAGWQWPLSDRITDFRVDPPMAWLGSTATSGLIENGGSGVVIGTETPGFGGAKMPLSDLSAFHPDGAFNTDTNGDGQLNALLFPAWLRNPSASGGDLIPSTPLWLPFLYRNPNNGTAWMDPTDHALGAWIDQSFVFGEPIQANSDGFLEMRRPRSQGQALWHYDGLFRDTAGAPTRTSDRFTR